MTSATRPHAAFNEAINRAVLANCADEFPEDWDLDELHLQMTIIFPTLHHALSSSTPCSHRDMLVDLFTDDAVELYETKETTTAPTTCARSSGA